MNDMTESVGGVIRNACFHENRYPFAHNLQSKRTSDPWKKVEIGCTNLTFAIKYFKMENISLRRGFL